MPKLSVVIPCVNGQPWILDCLRRLEQQSERESLEVIVCDRLRDDTAEVIRREFPWVRVEGGLHDFSIPALRLHGIKLANADLVAVIEDHVLTPQNWARQVVAAHAQGYDVVGGPVENASKGSLFDWAFFLLEYGPFLPPVEAAEGAEVPGVNISFKKSVLPLQDDRFAELWESFWIDHLREKGARICLHPGMVAEHRNPYKLPEFTQQKYLYSRSFAAMRVRGADLPVKLVYASVGATVLPVLLMARLIQSLWDKRRYRAEMFMALPLILLFVLCGVAGEVTGYLYGDGGSLRRVK